MQPLTDVTVKLTGIDGNAFMILGTVQKAMRRAKVEKSIIEDFQKDATSKDYDHLLQTVFKYCEVE